MDQREKIESIFIRVNTFLNIRLLSEEGISETRSVRQVAFTDFLTFLYY
jgi:predicted TIM-barrel enzyme